MKKGFTLIELLAVIIILAVIALIATPVVLNVVENAKKNANKNSVYGLIDSAKLYYAESLLDTSKQNNINGTTNVIDNLSISGSKPDSGFIFINNKGETALAVIYDKVCYIKNFNENDLTESEDIENCKLDIEETPIVPVVYKDSVLNGADPVLKKESTSLTTTTDTKIKAVQLANTVNEEVELIPVKIASDGKVTKASIYEKWYDYTNKEWANAVILKDKSITYEDGSEIPIDNIDGYFVWVPRYKYKIFNEGNYTSATTVSSKPSESVAQEIEIVFENKSMSISNGSKVGEYLTHPAFTTFDVNGLWVAKYETSGSTTDINVLPNVTSLREINIKTMFELSYNYERNFDSHMMKNTEWGAVAYLSHSKYGINKEVRINNSSTFTTGCAATTPALNYMGMYQTDHSEGYYNGCENAYNTEIGVLASTTGNITGIYDMSGGASEYMASYISNTYGESGFDATSIALYDDKYFDVYPSDSTVETYNNRILGDATGELGPFYYYKDSDKVSRYHSAWYGDLAYFVKSSSPWYFRSANYGNGVLAGSLHFSIYPGDAYIDISFRVVLDI